MKNNNLRFNAIFQEEPEGGFTVIIPALPGCVTYGKDLKEARKMAVDAIKGYLISLEKHHQSIPGEKNAFFSTVSLQYRV